VHLLMVNRASGKAACCFAGAKQSLCFRSAEPRRTEVLHFSRRKIGRAISAAA
jgi:hypothetical protein